MSIKLILLKSGESLIADAKEMVSGESGDKLCGYIFTDPFVVITQSAAPPVYLVEEKGKVDVSSKEQTEVSITLSPWIFLTEDRDIMVPFDWVVTIVDPVTDLKQMYEERSNAKQNGKVSITEG